MKCGKPRPGKRRWTVSYTHLDVYKRQVYGPQQFDMFVYYDYYYSEARDRMISGIMENQITDQEVAEYCICLGYTGEPGEDEKNMAKYNIALQRYWFNIEQMISDAVVKK